MSRKRKIHKGFLIYSLSIPYQGQGTSKEASFSFCFFFCQHVVNNKYLYQKKTTPNTQV